MNIEELKAMIPSETVRNYVLETGWTFTDKEKAALLYHSELPLEQQQFFWLRNLRDKTEDEALREQLTEYLDREEQAIRAFKKNGDRRCVYILKVREDGGYWDGKNLPCGYFFDWETAFDFGRREKTRFVIEKYLVDGVDEFDDGTCIHQPISELRFNEDGEITYVSSSEIPYIKRNVHHFTEMYFEMPNPFEQGDIVKTLWGSYGIVETSQEEWKKDVARHKEGIQQGDWSTDITDICIGIATFDEESGTFNFGGDYTPLNLELYQPNKDADGLMDKILMCRSLVDRGEASFDELYSLTMEYRKMRENTNEDKLERKALLEALGKGQWMTLDEIRARAETDCGYTGGDSIYSHMSWFRYKGYVQYARPYGTNEDYYCGFNEK